MLLHSKHMIMIMSIMANTTPYDVCTQCLLTWPFINDDLHQSSLILLILRVWRMCAYSSVCCCNAYRRKMTWREPSVCSSRQTDWAADSLSHLLTSCLETPSSTWLLWLISSTNTQHWPNLSIRTLTGVFWRVSALAALSRHTTTRKNGCRWLRTVQKYPRGRNMQDFFWIW